MARAVFRQENSKWQMLFFCVTVQMGRVVSRHGKWQMLFFDIRIKIAWVVTRHEDLQLYRRSRTVFAVFTSISFHLQIQD